MDFKSLLLQRRNARSRIWIGINALFSCPPNGNNFVRPFDRPSEYLTIVGIFHIYGGGYSLLGYGGWQIYSPDSERLTTLSEAKPSCGMAIASLLLLKMSLVSARKVSLLVATVCTVMLASVSQVRAERHPLPPQGVAVPEGGTT